MKWNPSKGTPWFTQESLLLSADFQFPFLSGTFRQSVLPRGVSSNSWKPRWYGFSLTSYLCTPWNPEGSPRREGPPWERRSGKRTGCGDHSSREENQDRPAKAWAPSAQSASTQTRSRGTLARFALSSGWRRTGLEVRNLHRTECLTETKKVHCQEPLSQQWPKVSNRGRQWVPWGHLKALQKGSAPTLKASTLFFCCELEVFKLEFKSRLKEPSNVCIQDLWLQLQNLWPLLQMGLWPKKKVLCHRGRKF